MNALQQPAAPETELAAKIGEYEGKPLAESIKTEFTPEEIAELDQSVFNNQNITYNTLGEDMTPELASSIAQKLRAFLSGTVKIEAVVAEMDKAYE